MRSKWLRKIDQLGDTSLPIGKPWFQMRRSLWGRPPFFLILIPVCWQGWLLLAALIGWLAGSVAIFIYLNWVPTNLTLYFWLLPTVIIWCGAIGIKTEVVCPQ